MEANEREPGTWDECGQALQEFQRGHHQMGGAIAVRGFELEENPAGWGAAQAFVAQGRARDVATQPFEFLPLMGAAPCVGRVYRVNSKYSLKSIPFGFKFKNVFD